MTRRPSKVATLSEAMGTVESGMTVFVDGFGYNRCPMAAVHELIRRSVKDLTITGSSEIQADMLIGAGVVSRIDNGWTGAEGWPHGSFSSYPMRRALEAGRLQVEYYCNAAIAYRLIGAAFGWPFVPFPGFEASDHFRLRSWMGERKAAMVEDPFTGRPVCVLHVLELDVCITHVQQADPEGNCLVRGPLVFTREAAYAARITIVTCEEVVPVEVTAAKVDQVVIPGAFVDYVVEVPWGAYPTACPYYYDYDWDHIRYYFEQSKDEASLAGYLKRYVHGTGSWEQFLDLVLTAEKRARLKASCWLGY